MGNIVVFGATSNCPYYDLEEVLRITRDAVKEEDVEDAIFLLRTLREVRGFHRGTREMEEELHSLAAALYARLGFEGDPDNWATAPLKYVDEEE